MKILMISIDRGLLGRGQLGDVVERHKKYGEFCDRFDIIVFSRKFSSPYQGEGGEGLPMTSANHLNPSLERRGIKISDKVCVFPTNSRFKFKYCCNAFKMGKKLFAENHYDLIVAQEPFLTGLAGYRLKKKFGAKLLVHFHGDFWDNPGWLKESRLNFLFLAISRFVVPRADAIRVMSAGQREKLIKSGIAEKKIRVISTPVDLNKFVSERVESTDGKTILHIGRDDEVKDYHTLISAFKLVRQKIPDAHLIQAGADQKIKKAMADNEVTSGVELMGKVPQDQLIKFYYLSDIFVLSSTSESFGKVLVEANACGKPVVSTATTGAKEIIEEGVNGFLVPIGDYETLAKQVSFLLENPDKAKEMGEKGRKMVEERFGDNTDRIIKFWQDIIKNQL